MTEIKSAVFHVVGRGPHTLTHNLNSVSPCVYQTNWLWVGVSVVDKQTIVVGPCDPDADFKVVVCVS